VAVPIRENPHVSGELSRNCDTVLLRRYEFDTSVRIP
jgi:hypothetical protein